VVFVSSNVKTRDLTPAAPHTPVNANSKNTLSDMYLSYLGVKLTELIAGKRQRAK
jgi:hypothetical protein